MKLINDRLLAALSLRQKRLNAGYYLIVILGIIAVYILIGDRTNIYSVKGHTQALTIDTTSSDINEWHFESGTLIAEDLFLEPVTLSSERYFTFAANAKLRVTSFNTVDQNRILITAKSTGQSGTLVSGRNSTPLSGYLELLVTISSNLILPFEGKAFLGEDVGRDVDSLLLDGEVSILESRFMSSGRYQGITYTLDTGDRATIVDLNNEYISKGFLRITDENAFYFSVVAEGDGVQVTRFGNEDLLLTPSIWSRVTKDPVVAAITSLCALLFLLLEFILLLKQTVKNKE
jgi:hypothetical protein